MSLMTYDEAFPWAESIRAELVASHMPPWNAEEGFGELKLAHALSSKELDIIMTWASGGNPRGSLDQKLPEVTLKNDWAMGAPDRGAAAALGVHGGRRQDGGHAGVHARHRPHRGALGAGRGSAAGHALHRPQRRHLREGRGRPATASPAPDRVLARWVPGQDAEPIDTGAAFRLPAGAELVARIHYKKTWQFEGKPLTDRSTVGVYFAQGRDARELLTVPITSETLPGADATNRKVTFGQTIDEDMQALALSPEQVPPNITLQVEAVRPDGSRAPMIRLNTRPDWERRYWFERPLTLPRGTRIEVTAHLEDPDMLSAAFSAAAAPRTAAPISKVRLALNVVPARGKPTAP